MLFLRSLVVTLSKCLTISVDIDQTTLVRPGNYSRLIAARQTAVFMLDRGSKSIIY